MNRFLIALLTFTLGLSSAANAAHYGSYIYATKNDMVSGIGGLEPPQNYNAKRFTGFENGQQTKIFLCTDTNSRRVPGKLIDGTCYVEWDGSEYGNNSFYVLQDNGYSWLELTNSNKSEVMSRGVTNPDGELDEGNHTYHCKIQVYGSNIITAGKYIPSRNGCYYSYLEALILKNTSQAKLSILVK